MCYYRISQFGHRKEKKYPWLFNFLCLTMWLCLTMGSENMVLVRLLKIGAKDLTVLSALSPHG